MNTATTNINPVFPTREAYLSEAAGLILDDLIMPFIESESLINPATGACYVRPDYRVSVGFPKHSRGGKAVAVCFSKEASTNGMNEIFINPEIDDPIEVLSAVTHELIHATDDLRSGHRHFFAAVARSVGLEGPLTATFAGDALKATLEEYVAMLGSFPHNRMVMDRAHKKGTTRQLKVECDWLLCGFMFRTSQAQMDKMMSSHRRCPACTNGKLSPA